MLIEVELGISDAEALLRHCTDHQPSMGDFRESTQLAEAMQTLTSAIHDNMNLKCFCEESKATIGPQLLEAAIALFGDKALPVQWLSKPVRAPRQKTVVVN